MELTLTPAPVGTLRHFGKAYLVYGLTELGGWTGENGRSLALCVLESPRGARYLITDHGKGYRPGAWNLGAPASQKCSAHRFVMSTPFQRYPLSREDVLAAIGKEG